MAKRIAVYGKGGSGKSTLAANLSLLFARKGMRVLQIGCDPKHDSTRALLGQRRANTIIDIIRERGGEARVKREDYLYAGPEGIGCAEAGGPDAGVGCAGLGITAAFRVIERDRVIRDYDVVVMDVLGDVVCGGFATPLLRGLADLVVIVVSETRMSLYAANNIARAVVRYRRAGARLAGLVVNNAGHPDRLWEVEAFAQRIGTRVLGVIPRDASFAEAERRLQTVTALDPSGTASVELARLCDWLQGCSTDGSDTASLTPLDDDELDEFFRGLAAG